LLVELSDLSENQYSLKAPPIINSQNFWSGSTKMGPVFYMLHSN